MKEIKSKYMVAVVANQAMAKVKEAIKPFNRRKDYNIVLHKGYDGNFRVVYVFQKDGIFCDPVVKEITKALDSLRERYGSNVYSGFRRINNEILIDNNPNDIAFYVQVSKTYAPSK